MEQALEDFLEIFNHHPVPCLFLPPLSDIASRLDCPPLLLYESLSRLRAKGYDYFMLDLNSAITIWLPDKLAAYSQTGGGFTGGTTHERAIP